jgi:hypothetical protein
MKVLRIIIGIFGLIIAIFCGGCGLYFLAVEPTALLIGGVPAAIGGLIAWWAFRRRPEDPPDTASEEQSES